MRGVFFKPLLSLMTVFILAGCSNSGSSSGGGPDVPLSGEETVARLPSNYQQNFENWKKRLVKSCDAAEAFGISKGARSTEGGLDAGVLLEGNGRSIVFADNGDLVVLTSYNSMAGVGVSRAQESIEVNGARQTLNAETTRDGSVCTVSLSGKKVYTTRIVESFVVGYHWNPGKQAQFLAPIPVVRPLGPPGLSEVAPHGISGLLWSALTPSPQSLTLLSRKLGLTEAETARLFKIQSRTTRAAFRVDGDPSSAWSNLENGGLIARHETLTRAFEGSPTILPIEARLEIPSLSFDNVSNSADVGNLKLTLDVQIAKKDATTFLYRPQTLRLQGLSPRDRAEGLECARRRALAYIGTSETNDKIQPTIQTMLGPCRVLLPEIDQAVYDSGLMKSLIPHVFAGVTPSASVNYGDWDTALSRLALETLAQGKDLRAELDPSSKTLIVARIANHLEPIGETLTRARHLASEKNLLLQMGLTWSLRGEVVSPSRISLMMGALDRAIDPFLISSQRVIVEMSFQPDSNDEALVFALRIDDALKGEALQALALATSLGDRTFERDVFNQTLQLGVSADEFQDWSGKFRVIRDEISGYQNLGGLKGDLVALSVQGLRSGEMKPKDLAPLYAAFENTAMTFPESSQSLLRALAQSQPGQAEALAFARGLSAEYKRLAIEVRDNAIKAGNKPWAEGFFASILQKRPSLPQLTAWNEMWQAIEGFTQRERTRTQGEPPSGNEWSREKIIDLAIKETWSRADFEGLEQIAEVARAKSSCERKKGASSLAECAGLRLFSKQKEMFLDPTFGGRYAGLARDFLQSLGEIQGFSWSNLRWTLMNEFFGPSRPMWSKCDQTVFQQKSSQLKGLILRIARETNSSKKWELERQIQDTVRNCP